MFGWLQVGIVGAVAVVLGVGALVLHHRGFLAGQNEREAHYAPVLRAADTALIAANARVDQQTARAEAITAQLESQHGQTETDLGARVDSARVRIAQLLRERPARCGPARSGPVPAVSGAAALPAGASASDASNTRDAGRLAALGGRCEHDAAEVTAFQQWYAQQRANAQAVSP